MEWRRCAAFVDATVRAAVGDVVPADAAAVDKAAVDKAAVDKAAVDKDAVDKSAVDKAESAAPAVVAARAAT